MNKEEAIKQLEIILQNIIEERKQGIASIEGIKFQEALQAVLNLIQKQDKIIKHLAAECSICSGRYEYMEIKEIIEYFEKVVDEDVKD